MRYRPMRFDPDYRPFVTPRCIYVVPLSADRANYRVLIPANLDKHLLDLLIQGRLRIRLFRGCPPDAVANIRGQLERDCSRGAALYGNRTSQLLIAGAALVVLGIVDLAIPDALVLADEILLIGAGVAATVAAYIARRRNLPLLKDKTSRALSRLQALDCGEDPLLDRIYEAIRTRGSPGTGPSKQELVDPIELESRWLVETLDLERLLDSGSAKLEDLHCLFEALSAAFPLSRFLDLERKLRRNPGNAKARRSRDRLAETCGLSADAFTVYAEFYRLAGEILEKK